MTNRQGRVFVAIFCAGLIPSLAVSRADAAFREHTWGARPAGLAGAYSALADDANAPAYNPAGVAKVQQTEATLMYARLFSGLKLYAGNDTTTLGLGYMSFVPKPLLPVGNFGFYWARFASAGVYSEDTVGLSWASSLKQLHVGLPETASLGLTLKYLQHRYVLDDFTTDDPVFKNGKSGAALGVDLGLQAELVPDWFEGLKLGLVAKNLNEPRVGLAERDRIPTELRVGLALQNPNLRDFTPTLEYSMRDGENELLGGVEGWLLQRTVGLRAGMNSREFGGGFSYRFRASEGVALQLDYTLLWPLYIDDSSGSHRLSMTGRFGSAPVPHRDGAYRKENGEWIQQQRSTDR